MYSTRIRKIAEMVPEGMVTADIGTDHAFLPILLASEKKCGKIYACDVRKGPLQAAEKNISEAGLSDAIACILSDGLENVPEDTECVVIAGMGAYTAMHILEAAEKRIPSFSTILIEVNRNVKEMREWLSGHHCIITDEVFLEEKGHAYTIMACVYGKEKLTESEILLGPVLMKKKDPAWLNYLKEEKEKKEKLLTLRPEDEELKSDYGIISCYLNDEGH